MGREERMRKERRNKSLPKWAHEDPERFDKEWSKKIDSWIGLIWASSKDRVFFTKGDYEKLLTKHDDTKAVLESIAVKLVNTRGDYYGVLIYLNVVDNHKNELGNEVISEIISQAERGTLIGERIFSIVDHARKILEDCGEKAMELQLRETTELLNNECCRALSPHIGMEIYRINQRWKPKE